MNDIIKSIEHIWNERLNSCIKKAGYTSQKAFITSFNKKYNTKCTQKDVSRWLHVGDIKTLPNSSNNDKVEKIGFPSYTNMIRIADFFNVQVGYLTGETDFDSFTLEKASNYLHLEQTAIKFIRSATSTDTAFRTARMMSHEAQTVLNKLLTAKFFPVFMRDFLDLDWEYTGPDKANKIWNNLEKSLGIDLLQEAFEYFNSNKDILDVPSSRPDLLEAIKEVEHAIDDCCNIDTDKKIHTDVFKYRLQQTFNEIIKELYPDK